MQFKPTAVLWARAHGARALCYGATAEPMAPGPLLWCGRPPPKHGMEVNDMFHIKELYLIVSLFISRSPPRHSHSELCS